MNEPWIAIDPGSISMGYCVVDKGAIIKKGSLISTSKDIGSRLNDLWDLLTPIISSPKLMVMELVRTSTGHYMLTWSAGIAVGAVAAKDILEIPTHLWKKTVDKDYYKSDVMDALYIAKFILKVCEEFSDEIDT